MPLILQLDIRLGSLLHPLVAVLPKKDAPLRIQYEAGS